MRSLSIWLVLGLVLTGARAQDKNVIDTVTDLINGQVMPGIADVQGVADNAIERVEDLEAKVKELEEKIAKGLPPAASPAATGDGAKPEEGPKDSGWASLEGCFLVVGECPKDRRQMRVYSTSDAWQEVAIRMRRDLKPGRQRRSQFFIETDDEEPEEEEEEEVQEEAAPEDEENAGEDGGEKTKGKKDGQRTEELRAQSLHACCPPKKEEGGGNSTVTN